MSRSRWIRITACENVPPREGRAVTVCGREIAIFNLGERFLAVDNRCPHQQGPLCDGIVAGATVVCPLHSWKIALESGEVLRPRGSLCVTTYATRVDDGIVSVEMQLPTASQYEHHGGTDRSIPGDLSARERHCPRA